MSQHRHRDRLPLPSDVRRDLELLQALCAKLAEEYEEAYDAALSRTSHGIVATSGSGFATGEARDPTGDTAVVAWEPRHIRSAVRFVAGAVDRAGRELFAAHHRIFDSFLDTDPDLRANRLAKRAAATQRTDG